MAKKDESILDQLALLPWWVGVGVAVFAFIMLAATIPKLAWVAVVFLLPAGFSAFESFRKRELLERQSGIDSIRRLTWREFEELLGEAYRRQGFLVTENSTAGPDGGIHLIITKGGERYLVQCKQWKVVKVGVKVVREMFGLMHAQTASGVLVVTSGLFTQDAKSFAGGKPIELVEGREALLTISASCNTLLSLPEPILNDCNFQFFARWPYPFRTVARAKYSWILDR